MSKKYASLDAAAERYDVSRATLRRLISAGVITGYRLGPRLLRVDLDEVDAAMRPIPTARRA